MRGAGCGCDSDTDSETDDEELEEILRGAGFGSFINKIKKSAKKTGKKIKDSVNKTNKQAKKDFTKLGDELKKQGKKAGKELSKSAKDGILKDIISESLDIGVPLASQALGSAAAAYMGGDPELGGEIAGELGSAGRETLREKTGYGAMVGSGKKKIPLALLLQMYSANPRRHPDERADLESILHKYSAVKKRGQTTTKKMDDVLDGYTCYPDKPKGKPRGAGSARGELIKKIMKKNPWMSLPDASKYIKQKNLKY